jgi:predicted amidohydrolase YtcJ
LGDLVVLSAGFMSVPEDQIRDIKADVTNRPGQRCFPALSRCGYLG